MGEVYLAEDTRLRRKVAIKVLPAEQASSPERQQRLEREALSASALAHPNVCVVYGAGEAPDGRLYVAMEWIDGMTLREAIVWGPFDAALAFDFAISVVSALAVAHAAGIVYCDVKLENVMVRLDGLVKVLDFGVAKLLEPEPESDTPLATRSGVLVGTPAYASPEQVRGQEVDRHADV
jgi:serine/threonine protein kinase